jgi:phosphoglycerate dehydrogenase-like enzyme
MRLAIIDDYERFSLDCQMLKRLEGRVDVEVFHDHVADEATVAERLADFEIVFIMRERTAFPRSLIERLPRLKLLITSGMRNASIDLDAARDRDVTVCGTRILPYPAAEHAWALILALAKRIAADDRAVRSGQWGSGVNLGLNGKTLGVVGLGKLGSQVARVGLAFGMKVIAWSENLTADRCAEVGVELTSKQTLFESADFISVHLVLGERSLGLVGATELESMKPTAYLINTSRGPIVDEQALIDVLKAGSIAGAGLDVFDVEPLPPDHPFRTLPNTVITPHQGYVTLENYEIFYRSAVDSVLAWIDGNPINVI